CVDERTRRRISRRLRMLTDLDEEQDSESGGRWNTLDNGSMQNVAYCSTDCSKRVLTSCAEASLLSRHLVRFVQSARKKCATSSSVVIWTTASLRRIADVEA
ncbi:hypothetical protein Tco_0664352, partial [Tanacetum coccineum]